eukprot:356174-Chlamydomonas_euryale.AAC.4
MRTLSALPSPPSLLHAGSRLLPLSTHTRQDRGHALQAPSNPAQQQQLLQQTHQGWGQRLRAACGTEPAAARRGAAASAAAAAEWGRGAGVEGATASLLVSARSRPPSVPRSARPN